ncbi:MAG: PD-(D/E)XK nuclease family protein [Patescibacteria group bacterium]|nr:PD-(D/E)XK nuclease family protein [Patescibacteria group bacterium]
MIALFISHTGLKDFLNCPRAYFLKNRFKNPKTGYRMQIVSAPMTLGSLVHDAIKWYLQTGRTASKDDVIKKYRNHWLKYRGKKGGFKDIEEEAVFGKKGLQMIDNFFENLSGLEPNLAEYDFLKYLIDEGIILNGKLDFIGILPDGSLHVLDFKTGTKDEDDPLQLHLYAILAESNFQKPVSKVSYWYLEREDAPREAVLDGLEEKIEWVKAKALEVKKAISENNWVCIKKEGLCRECKNYQAIIEGKGEFLFSDVNYKKDMYFLDQTNSI